MTGAMYAAIAGLKSHMSKLNVIGNNVANVNTPGYKAARAVFRESLYTTLQSGSNGSATSGGINPSQIGYGCSIGTIDLDMGTKNYVPTGLSTDCMIDGDGFFMVGDKLTAGAGGIIANTKAQNLLLTRVGDLEFDNSGYLVDGSGKVVYGFVTTSAAGDAAGPCANPPGVSTQLVPIRLPLAAVGGGADPGDPVKGGAIFPGVNGTGQNIYDMGTGGAAGTGLSTGKTIECQASSVSIDGKTGKITCVNDADGSNIVVGYIPMAKVSNPNGVSHTSGPYYRAGEGAGDCVAAALGDAMKGKYMDNATGANPGDVPIFAAGDTELITSGLESSGTDIATEFSEMITTQRGYQANTRIITVTDSMLEELVNIKR